MNCCYQDPFKQAPWRMWPPSRNCPRISRSLEARGGAGQINSLHYPVRNRLFGNGLAPTWPLLWRLPPCTAPISEGVEPELGGLWGILTTSAMNDSTFYTRASSHIFIIIIRTMKNMHFGFEIVTIYCIPCIIVMHFPIAWMLFQAQIHP